MNLGEIFSTMLVAGAVSFGGGTGLIAVAQHAWVETGLLAPATFAWAVALGQVTPGPTSVLVAALGFELAGVRGAGAALVGAVLPTWSLACLAGQGLQRFAGVLRRFSAATPWAIAPVIVLIAVRLAVPIRPGLWQWAAIALIAALVGSRKLDPLWIILIAGLIGWFT